MQQSFTGWIIFFAIVLVLLVFDLGVLHRKDHDIKLREGLLLSVFYIVIGLLYGLGIWFYLGTEKSNLYFTGFLVEKTLSLDNIFVISLILTQLQIPRQYQYRILFYGVLGAIILRGIMIALGVAVLAEFKWVLELFAAFLIFTGFKMLFMKEQVTNVSQNRLLVILKKYLPLTDNLHKNHFLTKIDHKYYATPLFLALCLVECADIIFAVDSIPAIFAITTDPYIIYTSNIFAILGLRALFFVVHDMLHRFVYLKYALALVLIFIGSKVFIADWLGINAFPSSISLSVTVCLLVGGIVLSLHKRDRNR